MQEFKGWTSSCVPPLSSQTGLEQTNSVLVLQKITSEQSSALQKGELWKVLP